MAERRPMAGTTTRRGARPGRVGIAGAICAVAVVVSAAQFAPAAPNAATGEIRANTTTAETQSRGSVAMNATGRFVAVWGDHTPPMARVFGRSGNPLSGEIPVEATPSEFASEPSVGMSDDGDFVVAWEDTDGDNDGVRFRRFDASGSPTGGEVVANTTTLADQDEPAAAMSAGGRFVVVWESCPFGDVGQEDGCGVYARLYQANGSPVTGELHVNQSTEGDQQGVAVAMDASGDFVVAWNSETNGHAYVRSYLSSGAPLTGEKKVSTDGYNYAAALSVQRDGDFVVAWDHDDDSGDEVIQARRYTLSGTAATGVKTVHSPGFEGEWAENPGVAMDPSGGFMVTWTGPTGPGDATDEVYARRFDNQNTTAGPEFRVNTTTAGDQAGQDPQGTGVASNSFSEPPKLFFVFLWSGNGPGDDAGVFVRRFDDTSPVRNRPDALISRSAGSGYVGDDEYNVTGEDQTKAATVDRGDTETFYIRGANDGNVTDTFRVDGCGGSGDFNVSYFKGASGSTNVTGQVTGGTYRLDDVPPGGFEVLRARVAVARSADKGDVKSCLVKLTSVGDATKKDAVKAKVTAG